ncbi:hypothetical protein [Fusibacter ferrireducens]|uniref:Uncharacterized protein n=1 Tax=Fusibacter ferrireducens TaxID=2785058 RepID=A0ABR9ZQG0_9FIRM|nr:hypothetical protein [Fusibacter ferrireducens]MBF4692221.1 hypothetical protein [Fusibacter ferrireducens]
MKKNILAVGLIGLMIMGSRMGAFAETSIGEVDIVSADDIRGSAFVASEQSYFEISEALFDFSNVAFDFSDGKALEINYVYDLAEMTNVEESKIEIMQMDTLEINTCVPLDALDQKKIINGLKFQLKNGSLY